MGRSDERETRFERLYGEHSAAVLAYAMRRSSPDEAADATAETFVVAWRRLSEVAGGEELPWLYAIARKTLSTQRRSSRRQDAVSDRVAFELREQNAPAPEAMAPSIVRALAELSEGEREVLMLTAWEDLSGREAAMVLGCSPTAYRIRLHRARKRLEVCLSGLDERAPCARQVGRPDIEEEFSC